MVNTFLVEVSFAASAAKLDYRRLGKQRVEAFQILNLLIDLQFCSQYFSMPLRKNSLSSDITAIVKRFQTSGLHLFFHFPTEMHVLLAPSTKITLFSANSSSSSSVPSDLLTSSGGTFDPFRVYNPPTFSWKPTEYRQVKKFGFARHPILGMWFGYTPALRHYINVHIEEWVRRGYTNQMRTYDLSAYSLPPSQELLLPLIIDVKKEKEKNEKEDVNSIIISTTTKKKASDPPPVPPASKRTKVEPGTTASVIAKECIELPPWCSNPQVIRQFRAALLEKEMTRKEPPHYQKMPEFVQSLPFTGYLWDGK